MNDKFAEGYFEAMRSFNMLKKAESSYMDVVKYPIGMALLGGGLLGAFGNYTHEMMTTPNDADLDVLESKALEHEARRRTRGLMKLKNTAKTVTNQPQRAIRDVMP